jgi:hypothetical protein
VAPPGTARWASSCRLLRVSGAPLARGQAVPLDLDAVPGHGQRLPDGGLGAGPPGHREPGDHAGRLRPAASGVVAGGAAVVPGRYLHVGAAGQPGHLEGGRVTAGQEPRLVAVRGQPGREGLGTDAGLKQGFPPVTLPPRASSEGRGGRIGGQVAEGVRLAEDHRQQRRARHAERVRELQELTESFRRALVLLARPGASKLGRIAKEFAEQRCIM